MSSFAINIGRSEYTFNTKKPLGSGATAVVYRGKSLETDQKVAVREVAFWDTYSLAKETRAQMTAMGHPGVVTCLGTKITRLPKINPISKKAEQPGRAYMVLEMMNGGELYDYVSRAGRLRPEECVHKIIELVRILKHCHANDIVHRDIKPENILLDEQGRLKLADFGFAEINESNRLMHTQCGSPSYVAPEIVRGFPYDAKISDLWSAGVVLYVMATGLLPFQNLSSVSKGTFIIPKNVDPGIADLIRQMMTVNPNNRITLEGILAHPSVVAHEQMLAREAREQEQAEAERERKPMIESRLKPGEDYSSVRRALDF